MQLALPTSSVCGNDNLWLSDVSLSLDLNQKRSVLFENMVVENSRKKGRGSDFLLTWS